MSYVFKKSSISRCLQKLSLKMNYLFNYDKDIYIIFNRNKTIIESMPIVIVQSAIVQFYVKKQVEKVEYTFPI